MTRRALALFLAMAVIWGLPYLFIRVAVAEITPATLVFARTALAALILLPLALWRADLGPVVRRWRWVVAFAMVEVGLPWVLLGTAEQHITSSLAALLVAGVPLVGAVIAVATKSRHRIDGTGLLGMLVGLVGVAAIVGATAETSTWTALLAMAVVVVCYAVGPVILAQRLGGVSSLGVMAFSVTLCALLYLPIAVVQRPASTPSAQVFVAVAILAVVCTALAFVLFAALIEAMGPVRATVITYVNPAVAALLGVVVLQEPFTVAMGVGLGLVILGSALATRGSSSEPAPARVAIGEERPAEAEVG